MRHHWQGNVRQLQNVISRAVLLCHGPLIEVQDLWEHAADQEQPALQPDAIALDAADLFGCSYKEAKAQLLEQFNARYLTEALKTARGNVTVAARHCGMERQALQRLLRKYQIESRSFR